RSATRASFSPSMSFPHSGRTGCTSTSTHPPCTDPDRRGPRPILAPPPARWRHGLSRTKECPRREENPSRRTYVHLAGGPHLVLKGAFYHAGHLRGPRGSRQMKMALGARSGKPISRRKLLTTAGSGVAGAALLRMAPWEAAAAPAQIKGTTLRILSWNHFV